jgi:hypothetical protein
VAGDELEDAAKLNALCHLPWPISDAKRRCHGMAALLSLLLLLLTSCTPPRDSVLLALVNATGSSLCSLQVKEPSPGSRYSINRLRNPSELPPGGLVILDLPRQTYDVRAMPCDDPDQPAFEFRTSEPARLVSTEVFYMGSEAVEGYGLMVVNRVDGTPICQVLSKPYGPDLPWGESLLPAGQSIGPGDSYLVIPQRAGLYDFRAEPCDTSQGSLGYTVQRVPIGAGIDVPWELGRAYPPDGRAIVPVQ